MHPFIAFKIVVRVRRYRRWVFLIDLSFVRPGLIVDHFLFERLARKVNAKDVIDQAVRVGQGIF